MIDRLFKKGLVVGLIILFIGIGIQPTISNEIQITKTSDVEEDCIECQTNANTHLPQKLLNRLGKNKVLSNVIKSNNADSLICEIILNTISRFWDLTDSLLDYLSTIPEDSILYKAITLTINSIYFYGEILVRLGDKFNCFDFPPDVK